MLPDCRAYFGDSLAAGGSPPKRGGQFVGRPGFDYYSLSRTCSFVLIATRKGHFPNASPGAKLFKEESCRSPQGNPLPNSR